MSRESNEMADFAKAVAEVIIGVACGAVAGKLLVAMRGKRWRDSIRGLLFAITLIAIALALIVIGLQ